MSQYSKHLTVTMATFIVLTGGTLLVRCDHVICKLCHYSSSSLAPNHAQKLYIAEYVSYTFVWLFVVL